MRWPGGGGIMLGTAGKDDSPFGQRRPGNDAVYLVCDDPDALFAAGDRGRAEVVRSPADEDYGSRGFTVRDPEGNLWSFGTYAGEGDIATGGRHLHDAGHRLGQGPRRQRSRGDRAFAAPDWVFVGENGIMPGERFLEAVASGKVSHDTMSSEVQDVRVYGDVAVVFCRVRNSGAFEGHAFTRDEWSTDVFVRRDDGWRCAVTHLTSVADS